VYQNIEKLRQLIDTEKLETTPLIDYFESVVNQGIVPKKKGLIAINNHESVDEIALKSFFMRTGLVEAFAHGIKKKKFVKKLKLVNCGLRDTKLIKILGALNPFAVRTIDISYNPLKS